MPLHSKNTKVFSNGYDLSAYLNKVSSSASANTSDKTPFGNTSKTYLSHQVDADIVIEGFWETANDIILEGLLAAENIEWCWYPYSDTLGNYGYGFKTIGTKYDISTTIDDAIRASFGNQSDVGRERGRSLHALAAKASAWTGTAIDDGAASTSGGSAYLQVTAITGTVEVKIEHSSDNFAGGDTTDLVSFTAASAIGSERVTFSGAVKQYIRGYAAIGGGETITFNILFCRN